MTSFAPAAHTAQRSAGREKEPPAASDGPTAGRSTSMSTVKISSTTSQPTAMVPAAESRRPLSVSTRRSTTVLATESPSPRKTPSAGE